MSDRKLRDSLSNLDTAVANLERALSLPTDQDRVIEAYDPLPRDPADP